jgi:hypothetical protein
LAKLGFQLDYGSKFAKTVAKIIDDPGRVAGVLQLPGRPLGPPADHEPDRSALREIGVPAHGDT